MFEFDVWVRHHETEVTPGCGGVRRKRTMVSSAHSEVNRRSLLPDGRCFRALSHLLICLLEIRIVSHLARSSHH